MIRGLEFYIFATQYGAPVMTPSRPVQDMIYLQQGVWERGINTGVSEDGGVP